MSIPDHARANFETLLRAAVDGNLALMECADAATGEPRYVICAVGNDGTEFLFTPFGLCRARYRPNYAGRRTMPSGRVFTGLFGDLAAT